jgi:ABC-type transporter MlaC component
VIPLEGSKTTEKGSALRPVDKVLEILNDPKLASQAAKEERRSRLRQVVYPRFDFADMARRCLGSTWQRISRREQEEFVKLFTPASGGILCQQHRVL